MLDKRAFFVGFMIGTLTNDDVPSRLWQEQLNHWCKMFKTTPVESKEMSEITEFMKYAYEVGGGNPNVFDE